MLMTITPRSIPSCPKAKRSTGKPKLPVFAKMAGRLMDLYLSSSHFNALASAVKANHRINGMAKPDIARSPVVLRGVVEVASE